MIPVSLAIKGLNSFRDDQLHFIDFQKLAEGQLFGIFGSVGSGKSTILDAITFALYGESERLNRGDNRNYNLMNLRSKELLIDFVFSHGPGLQQYRFTVKGKRNSKRFEQVNTFERVAYKFEGSVWIPLPEVNADQILGLSYENFRRTIIIPQGKFQEFLQLTDGERTKMLREIFSLHKFELSPKVASLEKKNNEKRDFLKGKLDSLQDVSQEILSGQQQHLKQLEANLAEQTDLLNHELAAQKEWAELKVLFEKIHHYTQVLNKLKEEQNSISEKEAFLKNYEFCLINFKPLIDQKKALQEKVRNVETSVLQKKEELGKLFKKSEQLEATFAEIKKEYDSREQYRIQIEDFRRIVKLNDVAIKLSELEARIGKGNDLLLEKDKNIQLCKQKVLDVKACKTVLKDSMQDLAELSEVRGWFIEMKNFYAQVHNCSDALKVSRKQLLDSLKKQFQNIPETLVKALQIKEDMQSSLIQAGIRTFIEEVSAASEVLGPQLEHLLVQKELAGLAKSLKEGEPCPVCGSAHHPGLGGEKNVDESISEVKEKKAFLEKQLGLANTALNQYVSLSEIIERDRLQVEQNQNKLETAQKQHSAHLNSFRWDNFSPDDEQPLIRAFEEASVKNRELKKIEGEEENLSRELEKHLSDKEQYQKGIEALKNNYSALEGEHNTLKRELSERTETAIVEKDNSAIAKMIAGLEKRIGEAEHRYAVQEKELKQINSSRDSLQGQVISNVAALEELKKDLELIAEELDKKLLSGAYSEGEVVRVLSLTIDIEQDKKLIDNFKKDLHHAAETLSTLNKEANGKTFDFAAYESFNERLRLLSQQVDEMKEACLQLREEIRNLEGQLSKKQELEKALDEILLRAEDIATLKRMFFSSGFVNFVSSRFLVDLCNRANERFYKLTRQKFRLEINENNSFQIRDYLNDGQVRSVKTLSGGQTFQASLSLALALAESIREQNKSSQNFFFLDEGFGTLDKESMHIVFETLKSLRKENRIVGLISHVEELQQEIDVFLKVHNDEESGSMVRGSWQ